MLFKTTVAILGFAASTAFSQCIQEYNYNSITTNIEAFSSFISDAQQNMVQSFLLTGGSNCYQRQSAIGKASSDLEQALGALQLIYAGIQISPTQSFSSLQEQSNLLGRSLPPACNQNQILNSFSQINTDLNSFEDQWTEYGNTQGPACQDIQFNLINSIGRLAAEVSTLQTEIDSCKLLCGTAPNPMAA